MVYIREMTDEDLEVILSWHNNTTPDDLYIWAENGFKHPLDIEQLNGRLKATDQETLWLYGIIADHQLIGMVELSVQKRDTNIGSIGKFYIQESFRNQGYGEKTLRLLIHKVLHQGSLNKLFLKVFTFNLPAIRCYEKVGFIKVKQENDVYQSHGKQWHRYYMMLESNN